MKKADLQNVAVETTVSSTKQGARLAVPIRINLLPHREANRERRRKDFITQATLVAVLALGIVLVGGVFINQSISNQQARNDFLSAQNAELDRQIDEIKTLREEIAALRARQKAVEDLQSDRTVPVHLFSELAKITPERVVLWQIKQEDKRVSMNGFAQTNERVAELLHNLAERSPWLERPELGEIKDSAATAGPVAKELRRAYEFSLNALLRKPDAQKAAAQSSPADTEAAAAAAPAAPVPAAVGPRISN